MIKLNLGKKGLTPEFIDNLKKNKAITKKEAIELVKNQILVIDDSTLMVPANRLAGLTINVETAFE